MSSQLTATPSDIPLQNLDQLLQPITLPQVSFNNWGRSFYCAPLAIFEPENEFQCELILELARREGKSVKATGVGHSPSDLACTNEYMLRTIKLNRVLEVWIRSFRSFLSLMYIMCRSMWKNVTSSHKGVSRYTIFTLN